MASNNVAREGLEALYGAKCFITGRISARTYHHILKKEYGGKSTIENGVVLNKDYHSWLHSLESTDYELFVLINECLELAKKVIELEDRSLMAEWLEVREKLAREPNLTYKKRRRKH